MIVKMQKWGNSLALRIPSSMAKQLGIQLNSLVNIEENGEKIIVEPIKTKTIFTRNSLLEHLLEKKYGNQNYLLS
jgi:antitoxin component of MazEF toxin-antitoxin module